MKHSIIRFDHICRAPDCQAVPGPSSRGIGVSLACGRCHFVADAEALLTGHPNQECHSCEELRDHIYRAQPERAS